MPRSPAPRWEQRSGRWLAALGPPGKTGRAASVILRDGAGRPVAEGDAAGARAAFDSILAARAEAERRQASPTVADLIVEFVRWNRAEGKAPRTIETHEFHLRRFMEFEHGGTAYEDRAASSITLADWTRYRKAREAAGWATGTMKIAFASITACWRWAARPVEEREPVQLLMTNPFDGARRPRKGPGRRQVLSRDVIDRLLVFAESMALAGFQGHWARNRKVAWVRQRNSNRLKALALRVIAECGARPSEVLGLRWDWVIEAERVAEIPPEHTKTRVEVRIIGLSPEVAAELARLRTSGETHPVFVFATAEEVWRKKPLRVSTFDGWFRGLRRAARESGLDVPEWATPYTLRHSFVSQARAGGVGVRELSLGMGHSSAIAESLYAHAWRGEIRELMDRAREAVRSITPPAGAP